MAPSNQELLSLFALIFQLGHIFVGLCDGVPQNDTSRNESSVKSLLDQLYQTDSRIRPGSLGSGATVVRIDFYVQSFGPLNEIEMEFGVDLDFRQTWEDLRLAYDSSVDLPVYIPPQDINRFWIPDIYFPNEKSGESHDITIPNKSLRIYRNGTVRYLSRMAMMLSCTMNLETFPLDSQMCEIKISTYSYDDLEISLEWFDSTPIEIRLDELNLPQFSLLEYTHDFCNETYKTGSYSCLSAKFFLRRKVGFFVLQTYVPSILIVMLSWVAFWINKNSEPARVALGVTTVLTMTTQLTSSRSTMMRVSYLKAIDVWYSACMLFVFGALIEYAFVNVSVRMEKKIEVSDANHAAAAKDGELDLEKQTPNSISSDVRSECASIPRRLLSCLRKVRSKMSSKSIDQLSRQLFPLTFLLFNIVYWLFYIILAGRY